MSESRGFSSMFFKDAQVMSVVALLTLRNHIMENLSWYQHQQDSSYLPDKAGSLLPYYVYWMCMKSLKLCNIIQQ